MRQSNRCATALAVVGALTAAHAAIAAPPPIGGGGQIQQIPPAPTPERSIPDIRIDRGAKPRDAGPAGPKVLVRSLRVTGETLFPESELVAVTGFQPGGQLDLHDLRIMAGKISAFYNRRGYFVAQAYVPAQGIEDGAVTIVVIEGHYGKVGLDNRTNLSNRLALSVLRGLDSGDVVAGAPLERRLLLLSDIPGVVVKSTLSPGAAVGSSDLTVALTPGPRFSGSIDGDNAGSPYSGVYRLGGTLDINDPTGHGDQLTLRALSSFDGLDYGRAAYQVRVQDATVGVSYAALDYRLHGAFAALQAHGTAQVASVYASYPLVRSYDNNLELLGDFDYRTFQDKEDAVPSVVDKRETAFQVGISGDHHDGFGGGGWNQFALGYTFGDLDLQTPSDRLIDEATAHANGQYGKLAYSLSRLQAVAGPFSIYGLIRGQFASKNLDISEKMELGGAYAVRSFAEGEFYGDTGYVATLEARLLLPPPPREIPGRLQIFGFFDTGAVKTNQDPWLPGPNRQSGSGAGAGVTWTAPGNYLVRATWAHVVGDATGIPGPISHDRAWVQLVKFF
ncbi:MAG TPA: ShlB/FhaC/HecB family hemolysin secretion/activation protein [Caulobacteraceae bacterium]